MKKLLLFFLFFAAIGMNSQTVTPAVDSVATPPTMPLDTTAMAQPAATTTLVTDMPPVPVIKKHVNPLVVKRADQLYKDRAYSEAIPYYKKALESDNTNKEWLTNLGDCYRMTNNLLGKLEAYGSLVRLNVAEPLDELYYGQALMEHGEVEKAKPFFEKYAADNRGKELATSFSKMKMYKRNADAYNVTPVAFNSAQNDMCAVKFNDGIVFASTRKKTEWIQRTQGWTDGNFMHLYYTERTNNGQDSPPKLFMGDMNSKYNDGPVCFTKDYQTVYFTRNSSKSNEQASDGTYKLKVFEASLDANGFSMVHLLPFNNNDHNCMHPSLSNDGRTLYFASDMPGGKGGLDIYMCNKDSSGSWGEPVNLGDVVNTAGNEMFPFIAADGRLFFSSNGHDGMGGLDIYEARILGGKASKIYNMGEPVNSMADDFGIFLYEDGKNGFISSNRDGGGMNDDIYELKILRDVKRGKEVVLIVKDKYSGEALPGTKLVINGDTVLSNEKGEYITSAEDEMQYKVEAVKADYYPLEDTYSANSSLEDSFTKELLIEKDPKLFLRGVITDAKDNQLMQGVTVQLIDIETNTELDNYITTASGDYFKFMNGKRIGDRLTYLIKLSKPGYLERSLVFTYTIEKPGEINLNDHLKLALGKVEVGMDLAKMVDLKPIYFDVGKSDIRKDAALELDKIVQIMNEYPNMCIELGSHTDCRNSAASNLKLSTARAKSSVDYIVKKGINKMRITAKGYGESKLLNNCACEGKVVSTCTEAEHEANRRTEFIITRFN